jgi:uncharacterized integral membrane protein (TIGR00698 family)
MTQLSGFIGWTAARWRGTLLAVIIGAASLFIAENYGGPAVLFALLIGMAFHFLSEDPRTTTGIQFSSSTVLRLGVALLGARISAEQLSLLSLPVLALIIFSLLVNRFSFRWPKTEAALAGASVAICGASAAIALGATLNKKQLREQALLAVVVTVTVLSTIAMVLYPMLSAWLGLDAGQAGLLLGGTIHDVAQVVGAGAMIGPEALEIASMTKMLRVSMLIPMLILFMLLFSSKGGETQDEKIKPWYRNIPLFLFGFIALALLNVFGFIPEKMSAALGEVSRLFILISIAALGLKTSLGKLRDVGWTPILLMAADTLFLLVWVVSGILLIGA